MKSDSPPSPDQPIAALEFVDCDQLMDVVRGGDGEFLQIGAGKCSGSMRRIAFDGFDLLSADLTNKTIVNAAADSSLQVVHLPLRWEGEMRWNGKRVEQPTALVWGKDASWSRVASESSVATLGFQRDFLFSRLAEWTGRDPEDSWSFDGDLLPLSSVVNRLLEKVREIIALSRSSPDLFHSRKARKEIRDAVLSALLSATTETSLSGSERLPSSKRRETVSLATDFLRSSEGAAASLSDLCRVADVSARSLAYAFEEHFGMSPIRFDRVRRLNRVRSLLLDSSPEEVGVASAAMKNGFYHLGHFAAAYRDLFGEAPSETLQRGRG